MPRPTREERRPAPVPPSPRADQRFVDLDPYRARREWLRYEGTAQRDLFRELRERFLDRHRAESGWVLDAGAGPGRFTTGIGGAAAEKVAVDLSLEMLRTAEEEWARQGRSPADRPHRVRGDLLVPPFGERRFDSVVALGNTLGFVAEAGDRLLRALDALLRPGGTLVIEIAPGTGERSRYLARLPPAAVGRLLRAPPRLVVPRIVREGFASEPRRHEERGFRRWSPAQLVGALEPRGWSVSEAMAVAPALGADPERLEEVARDRSGWQRLIEVEETIGRLPERQARAAATILAFSRTE